MTFYTFANATTSIPLANLDANFATPITLGNTAVTINGTFSSIGNLTLNNATIASGNSTVTKETVTTITSPAATNLTIQSAGTTAMTIDTSQNVGIGTTSPTQKLDVYGGSGAAISLVRAVSGQNSFLSLVGNGNSFLSTSFDIIQDTNNAASLNQRANGPLQIYTNNQERIRIEAGGNTGIGTSSPNASAILDVQSTTKGVRFPNMTTTQKNAISSPAAGLVVFDTTLSKLCVYTGTAWQTITSV